jgi:transcriptional regulator with XRE-family HTH domain
LDVSVPSLEETVPDTARRIREAQRARGLTNEELARRTGVALRTILRWRKGERPRLPNLLRLADALGVPRAYFVQDLEQRLAIEDLAHEIADLSDRTEELAGRVSALERLLHEHLAHELAPPGRLKDRSLGLPR